MGHIEPKVWEDHSHSGIQAHSMGDLFPCIIARMERYPAGESALTAWPSTSWELTLDGRSEEYATRGDAEMVARFLISCPSGRAKWARRNPDIIADMARYAARHPEIAGARDANPGRAVDLGGRHG